MKQPLIALLVLLFLVACKESEIITPTPEELKSCLLTEINSIDSFGHEYKELYQYDTNDRLERISFFNRKNLYRHDTFKYNDKGNIITRNMHNAYGGWAIANEYKYDNQGLLIENKEYDLFTNVSPYPVHSITTYNYSSKSQLESFRSELTSGAIAENSYEYVNSKLIKHFTFKNAKDNTDIYTKYVFEFDLKANILSASPAFQKIYWVDSNALPFTTNRPNILSQKEYFGKGNTNAYASYRCTFEYNESGYPIKEERVSLEGQTVTLTYTYTCK